MADNTTYYHDDDFPWESDRSGPQHIGEVLAELLSQYESRFPDLQITIVEQPVSAW